MALNLSQLLGGAGVAAGSMRQAEEAERVARQNQLAIEERNRLDQLRQEMLRAPMPQVPQFNVQGGMFPVRQIAAAPAAPVAPAAPATAAAAPAAFRPSQNYGPGMTGAETTAYVPPPDGLTAKQFQAMSPAERKRVLQAENDRRLAGAVASSVGLMAASPFVGAADLFVGGPYNTVANTGTWLANKLGVPRLGRALGVYGPEVTEVEIPRIGSGTATPFAEKTIKAAKDLPVQEITEGEFLNELKRRDAEISSRYSTPFSPAAPAAAPAAAAPAAAAPAAAPTVEDWKKNAKGQPILGLVNNNPGNIRPDKRYQWDGAVGVNGGFVQFATPEAGIRAMAMNLLSYNKQGINTVQGIINRWAPPQDKNNTPKYIKDVSSALGVSPTDTLNLQDPDVMRKLVTIMITVENGKQPYADNVLSAGITAGMSGAPAAVAAATPAAPAVAPTPAAAAGAPTARLTTPPASAAGTVSSAVAPEATLAPTAQNLANQVLNATEKLIQVDPTMLSRAMQDTQEFATRQRTLLARQRNDAAQLAQLYMRSGTATGLQQGQQLMAAVGQADLGLMQFDKQIRETMVYMQGMQGLQEFAMGNNPSRLVGVWSYFSGAPVGVQMRDDGMFDLFFNGERVREGLSKDAIQSLAQQSMFQSARDAISKSAALENELALKQKYGDARTNALKDIWVALINQQGKLAEERAKAMQGKLTVDTNSGGAYLQVPEGVFFLTKSGVVELPGGAMIAPITAQRVTIAGR